MSLGFFLSSAGQGTTSPNGMIVLLWLGAVSLTVGLLTLGVALIVGPRTGSAQWAQPARTILPSSAGDASSGCVGSTRTV
jgi:hypothetical protein